jgi:hypothetical protein
LAGVYGAGSSSSMRASGVLGGFLTPEQSAQGQAATGNTFNLRAKALAVRQGYEEVQDGSSQGKQPNNLDPAVLARIAVEEELKKRGGGGGGSRPFNPMLWVPYSFKLLAKAIEDLRQAFNRAIDQSFMAIPNTISVVATDTMSAVNRFMAPVLNPIVSGMAQGLSSMAKAIESFMKNPIAATNRMLNNSVQIAVAITSAIINGLKKVFFGKDEEKLELDETVYESEESSGLISRLLSFFSKNK